MRGTWLLGGLAMLTAVGCVVSTEPETDPDELGVALAEAAGGCRMVCPKCHPGQICPMMACTIQCAPGHSMCGPTVCHPGEYCCNESCGICAPAGGFCTEQYCGELEVEQCGDVTCPAGMECCNPSCGTCTEPGGFCTQELCDGVPVE